MQYRRFQAMPYNAESFHTEGNLCFTQVSVLKITIEIKCELCETQTLSAVLIYFTLLVVLFIFCKTVEYKDSLSFFSQFPVHCTFLTAFVGVFIKTSKIQSTSKSNCQSVDFEISVYSHSSLVLLFA